MALHALQRLLVATLLSEFVLSGSSHGFSGSLADIADMIDCGVVSRPESAGPLGCHEQAQTDCASMSHIADGGICPRHCPYVAPHPYLSCVFECTTDWGCSRANAAFAFPNNETQTCEPCSVVGCRRCSSKDVCMECFDNFWLEFGGRVCAYVWDDRAQHGMRTAGALSIVLVFLLAIIVFVIDRCNCFGGCLPEETPINLDGDIELEDNLDEDPGPQPLISTGPSGFDFDVDKTIRALNQGKLHRLRCKVKDLEVPKEGSSSQGPSRSFKKLPFGIDLQSKYIVGVGLPLFHQWYYFLILYSLMMCAGTAYIYKGSALSGQLQKTGLDHASSYLLGENAMSLCALNTRHDLLGEAIEAFGLRCAVGYGVLWLMGLALTLAHAARQKRLAATFHQRHVCLAEFVLNIEGFPPDATNEEQMRSFVCEAFGNEDLEVSVCYDYRSRREKVHELLEKVLVKEDVDSGTYDAALAVGSAGARGLGLSEEEKAEVRSWMIPGATDCLKNAGGVFIIFPHNYDLQLARQRFDDELSYRTPSTMPSGRARGRDRRGVPMLPHSATPEWLPAGPLHWVGGDTVKDGIHLPGRMHELRVRDVVCEPPEIVWDHLGMSSQDVAWRAILGSFVIIISYAVISAVIFVPLASYSINYVSQAGSLPTGMMMSVLGILVMSANWIIGMAHIFVTSRVGFSRRDREGLLIFKAFSTLCLVSFLFNVAITIFPDSSSDPVHLLINPLSSGKMVASMQDISFQVRASVHLFHVLVPGGLFIGYLIFPLQGFVWPFISTLACLRCWHRRTFNPDLKAREAELALEPLGLSLGHDYMGHIVQPFSCSLVLFFASGVAWQTFACLAAWAVFMMGFSRNIHLRSVRRCYFSTNRLDTDALYAWGAPLSLVLAASAFWAARIQRLPLYVVPIAWCFSIAVYSFFLAFYVQPLSVPKDESSCHRPSYDEVRARRFYDWHNCNPIKVLLSHCIEDADPIVPFVVGKEYLQFQDPAWKARFDKVSTSGRMDRFSHRTYSDEAGDRIWENIIPVPEVETLVQRPLDVMNSIAKQFSPKHPRISSKPGPATVERGRGPPASGSTSLFPRDEEPEKSTSYTNSVPE